MVQWDGNLYRWANESEAFIVEDVDTHYYACKYVGSLLGFVIDKDAFNRQMQKGRIQKHRNADVAV